ncbi:hypothetical protein Lfu02_27550 [Longispora fulva]|uniref:Uncharacterized protein n=1 Tax=Longispora fulva TaxID=619741 RepID=A0A8J7GR07_9ACTN|nr:hypothetical protein [Longispora fulva]MBG6138890.1 hypothetical protein [Longispora fulva]GIG58383.1 hypothetical protein Lfu02_27550 [Longispora fulva]
MTWKSRLVGTIAALSLAMLGMAGQATASGSVPQPQWMKCPRPVVTGDVYSITVGQQVSAGYWDLSVAGTVTPCHTPGELESFTVVTFSNGQDTSGWADHYADLTNGNQFAGVHVEAPTTADAVCLATAPSTRLACFAVTWPNGTAAAPVIGDRIPLAVTEHWGNMTLRWQPTSGPTCGFCWPVSG